MIFLVLILVYKLLYIYIHYAFNNVATWQCDTCVIHSILFCLSIVLSTERDSLNIVMIHQKLSLIFFPFCWFLKLPVIILFLQKIHIPKLKSSPRKCRTASGRQITKMMFVICKFKPTFSENMFWKTKLL